MTAGFVYNRIVVRGAGDIATGVIRRLAAAGLEVIALEQPSPSCIRRKVCFADAVFNQKVTIEDFAAELVESVENVPAIFASGDIPILIDPEAKYLPNLKPLAIIDARMLKENINTNLNDAPIVIGLGPGFTTSRNCHAAVETNRGANLGRVILSGSTSADTGVPAEVNGYSRQRVVRSPADGIFQSACEIGDVVTSNQILGYVAELQVEAKIDGVVRGIINDNLTVGKNQKIGDIDPRGIRDACFRISDKAIAVGDGVYKALMILKDRMDSH
ncbi:MAG: EF2563 family selenium-dependent molybdenum hydroxylase system protein [FCB group bacterium]|nr:EF2563 family selenium-dependent molybdenum hydroxylase system protein [FCB group bacterium]